MSLVHRINSSGLFIEDVVLEPNAEGRCELPAGCVDVHPPEGMQWPQFVRGTWIDAGVPFQRNEAGDLNFPEE